MRRVTAHNGGSSVRLFENCKTKLWIDLADFANQAIANKCARVEPPAPKFSRFQVIHGLARRSSLPVTVRVPEERLSGSVEVAAYYVISESLTNVAKHARAGRVDVTAEVADGALTVTIADDGAGGADPGGSGLRGLADRVEALRGTLCVESPQEGGTVVVALLPLDAG